MLLGECAARLRSLSLAQVEDAVDCRQNQCKVGHENV